LLHYIAFYVGRTLLQTDASITAFLGEFFNDLVVLEPRMFKIITSFAAENMGKKWGLPGVDRLKILHCMKKGTRKANI